MHFNLLYMHYYESLHNYHHNYTMVSMLLLLNDSVIVRNNESVMIFDSSHC